MTIRNETPQSGVTRADMLLVSTLGMLIVLAVVSAILMFTNSMENALWGVINNSMGGGVPVSCPARFYVGEVATVKTTVFMPYVKGQAVETNVQFYTEQSNNGQRNYLCETQRLLVGSPEGVTSSCSFVVSESARYLMVMVAVDTDEQVAGYYRFWGSCRAPAIHRWNIVQRIASYTKPGWILIASLTGILITGSVLQAERYRQKYGHPDTSLVGIEADSDEPVED